MNQTILKLQNEFIWSAKQSKRREDGMAIVNTGMRIKIAEDLTISESALVFGGMAATTSAAKRASTHMLGK